MRKLSALVSKEVMKKTVYDKPNSKVSNLEKKIFDVCNLFQTNQYNTDKHNLERKIGDVKNKTSDISSLVNTAVFKTKTDEIEKKIRNTSGTATNLVLNTKIG